MITTTNPIVTCDKTTFPIYDLFDDLISLIFAQCVLKDFINLKRTCQSMDHLGKVHVARLIDLGQIKTTSLLKFLTLPQLIHYIGTSKLNRLSLKCFVHIRNADITLIVQKFPRLKLLELANSTITQIAFEEISQLTQLECLSFISCNRITNLDHLTKLTGLKWIRINSCKVKNLPSFDQWKYLETIEISCVNVESIPDFVDFNYLREISIRSCHRLKNLPTVGKLTTLTLFKFNHCNSIPWETTKEWVSKTRKLNPHCEFIYYKK